MKIQHFIKKNRPAILAASGVMVLISSTIVAIKTAKKSEEVLDKLPEDATTQEKLLAVAPVWGATVGLMAIGTGFIILSLRETGRREEALVALYALSEAATGRWKEAVVGTLTPKKAEEVRLAVVAPREEIPSDLTDKEGSLFFDTFSGRYFRARSVEVVRAACNSANELMFGEDFVSLNEFYDYLGLPNAQYGDEWGFKVFDGKIEMRYDSFIHDDTAVISISFLKEPRMGHIE